MDGNALDIALALLRSPSKRFLFAHSPLPADVSEVIFLAAAAPERLAQARERTGETEEKIIEAARFYVREVLLFDGANAYRLLGATPASDPAVIKAHHRALQQWLHPDRRGDEWESIYATRINAAWSELRSPQRRALYDARATDAQPAERAHRTLVSGWRATPAQQPRAHEYIAIGIALALFVGLLILLDHASNEPAPKWQPSDAESLTHSQMSVPTPPAPAVATAQLPQAAQARPKTAPQPTQPLPSKVAIAAAVAVAAPVAPASAPKLVPPTLLSSARNAAPALAVASKVPQALAVAHVAAPATAAVRKPALDLAAARKTSPTVAAAPRPAQPIAAITFAPPPPTDQPSAPERVAAQPSATAHAAPAPVAMPSIDLQRVALAQRLGRDVTRFLASRSSNVPPLWRNARALDAATSIRRRIDSGRGHGAGHARFGEPVWRIAQDRASMVARIDGAPVAAGANRLRVELAWRDGMWLVDGIAADMQ